MPPLLQPIAAPGAERNRALAQALLQQAQSQPNRTPLQTLGNLAQVVAGEFAKADAARQERDRHGALAEAIQTASTAKPFINPDTGQVAPGTEPQDVLVRALMEKGFPEIASQVQLGQFDRRQQLADTLAGEQRQEAATVRAEERAEAADIRKADRTPEKPDRALVEVFDPDSPTGTRLVPRAEAAGRPGKPASGLAVDVGPEGGVSVRQGRGASTSSQLQTSTQKDIEKNKIGLSEQLNSVRNQLAQFRPEFLEVFERGRLTAASVGEKLGQNVDPGTRNDLIEFSVFKADSSRLFAETLKQFSGAAVTPAEAQRAESFIPKAGVGLMDGDAPTEFEAKARWLESFLSSALLRQDLFQSQGLSLEQTATQIPLVGQNPTSGKRVFLGEFFERMTATNPGATSQEILQLWNTKYAQPAG